MIDLKLNDYSKAQKFSLFIYASVFAFSGSIHIIKPELFLDYMPPFIPFAWWVVFLTGPTEIIGAIALINPKWRVFGTLWCNLHLIGFLILHIWHVYIGGEIPNDSVEPINIYFVWFRLILQFFFIYDMFKLYKTSRSNIGQ